MGLLELCELDGLEDLLDTLLEELDLHGLDALVIEYEVIVNGSIALNAIEDASLEEAFTAWTRLDELAGDLATVSTVDDHTLVAHVIGENSVDTTIEHEAVIIELLNTCSCGQRSAGLVVVLLDEGLSDGSERLRVAVLELKNGMSLVNWLFNADVLL